MKRVFSSSDEVIHVFAQQKQSEGRSSNVYFEDTTRLYSYGRHYPLAMFVKNKKGETAVIINTQGYSSTTTGHISSVRYATNHYKQFMLPNTEAMKGILHADLFVKQGVSAALSTAIIKCVDSYFYSLRSDTKKRKSATLESWKQSALSQCSGYIEILEWFGFTMTPAARAALKKLSGLSPVEAKEAAQKAKAIEDKKRAKAIAEQNKQHAALLKHCVKAWLAGEFVFTDDSGAQHNTLHWIARNETVLLRVNGDDVETSKGVKFPLEHGLKALPLIELAKGKGWHKNGHTIHLGHYQIDEILPNGDVKAGCHLVPYSEIERISNQVKGA